MNGLRIALARVALLPATAARAADPPPEFVEAGERRRCEIPLGGDFRPQPTEPVFVAVGHGARILLSRDDGKTWKQLHDFEPETEHVHGAQGLRDIVFGCAAPTGR